MSIQIHSLDQLADRLNKLERQNRRLKQFGGCLLVVMGLVLLGAAQRQSPAQATELVLRNAEGKDRARLEIAKGDPMLRFLDENGRNVATMGISRGVLVVQLWDEAGRVQTGWALQGDGVALVCHDSDGTLQTGRNALLQTAGVFRGR
jgi:hypothetical protein